MAWIVAATGVVALAAGLMLAPTPDGASEPVSVGKVVDVSGPPPGLPLEPSFREEFDGSTLDRKRWSFAYYDQTREQPTIAKRSLWSNGEHQVYFDPDFLGLGINPFRLGGGALTIEAKPLSRNARAEVSAAIAKQPARVASSALRDVEYSSGLITTRSSFQQTYGYFEMRARWSAGKGLWPAFWLLPADGSWPPEIDVLEAHGDKPTVAFHSKHSELEDTVTKRGAIQGTSQEFHTYGLLWTPRTLDFYIDGAKTVSFPTPGDMNKPMYLLANLAVGGKWPGYPDAGTHFPATMDIDYIRAWRFRRGSEPR